MVEVRTLNLRPLTRLEEDVNNFRNGVGIEGVVGEFFPIGVLDELGPVVVLLFFASNRWAFGVAIILKSRSFGGSESSAACTFCIGVFCKEAAAKPVTHAVVRKSLRFIVAPLRKVLMM